LALSIFRVVSWLKVQALNATLSRSLLCTCRTMSM
jgi:hypothetical protein